MSIYGEGLYRDADGGIVEDVVRTPRRERRRSVGPPRRAGPPARAGADAGMEAAGPGLGLRATKYVQERLTLTLAPAYGMEGVALRLWNVYGPGQALSNPYTGVLAIFSSRLHNGQPPMIFEDGQQRRDFVHVEDVAQAFVLALEHEKAPGGVFNVGSGEDRSVSDVAQLLAKAMGRRSRRRSPARLASATSATASPTSRKIRDELGFAPRRDFRGRACRACRLGRRAGGRGSGQRGARANSKRGASSHEGTATRPAAPALVRRRPVLVTGGAGFIGSNLADRFAREGHDVLVYDALARPGVERNLDWLKRGTRSGSRRVDRRHSRRGRRSRRRREDAAPCSTWRRRSP